jgi:SAM-dependent methyltransferase
MRALKPKGEEKLKILDLGSTSPENIAFLTELGLRVYNEDVLRACKEPCYMVRAEDGADTISSELFFTENLSYPEGEFDAVLCWDLLDYVPEPVVTPAVQRIYSILKPHGSMLAFFHTKDVGPDSPHYRYHIAQPDTLALEAKPAFRLQRVFQNRHLENLFAEFSSRKFFLGRDNIREVIVVK